MIVIEILIIQITRGAWFLIKNMLFCDDIIYFGTQVPIF